MRLILVEHGGERVCGDSAVFAARSPEWADNTFQRAPVGELAVVAARLLDESEGRFRWNYQFRLFGPCERGGYDVFACAEDMDDAPPDDLQNITEVYCRCFYIGFVLCLKPVIPFHLKRRHGEGEQPALGHRRRGRMKRRPAG